MKNFAVYKSSAGSGKTTTLAIEYLKLSLDKPADFKHILALTFTKDAANEMKQRIVEYLIKIIHYQGGNQLDFILDPIIQTFNKKYIQAEQIPERLESIEEIQKQARILLTLILHGYSDFAISTIDSFTHRIIKSFAHDLGIAISFEVELDSENLLKTAVNELISRAGADNQKLTEVLLDFSLHKIGSDKSRKIDTDLRALANNLLDDVKEEYLIDLRKLSIDELLKMKDQVFKEVKYFDSFVNKEAQLAKKIIQKQGLDCKSFYYGIGNICNWFFKLAKPNFATDEIRPKERVLKSINEDIWCAGKTDETDKDKIESIKEELKIHFHNLNDFIDKNIDSYLIYRQISQNIYPLVVLNEIEKLIFQLKTESNVLHISDFNKLIAKAITGEPAPFIYERIGNWYKHFLLDEFQDTSALQWNNLLPLIENSLSENQYNLVVGDGKQSIYRWRGSDVNQFVSLPDLLKKPDALTEQREHLLQENYEERFLQTNFRSDEEIVKFNNDLFRFIKSSEWLPEKTQKVYNEVEQTVDTNKQGAGMVDILLMDEKDDELLNSNMINVIQTAKNEGYAYKDMAVLVRKNADATSFADLLLTHQIPVISSVALRVSSSAKVKFILSFFQSVLNPDEVLYKIELLRFLLQEQALGDRSLENFHLLVADLMADKRGFSPAFYALLDLNGFPIDFNKIGQTDVYELAEYIIRVFKLQKPDAYVQFFLDCLIEFKRTPYNLLNDFFSWWNDKESKFFIELPKGLDAVTIQTVFKAKGLQYPVVIYPVTDSSFQTQSAKNKSWLNPGIENINQLKSFPFLISSLKDTSLSSAYEEEQSNQKLDDVNIFYVALTRAKHRLFILANQFEEKKSKKANENRYNSFKPSVLFNEYLAEKDEYIIDEGYYRFGKNRHFPVSNQIEDSHFYYLKKFYGASWRNYLKLSDSAQYQELDEDKSQKMWGIYVHEILADIQNIEDVARAQDRALYAGFLKSDQQKTISQYINQIIQHPILGEFYLKGLKVANEADLLDSFGLFHRPDRLVFLEDKTVIIDYKTGKPNEKHAAQIQEYADLLMQIGFPKVVSYLVYLHKEVEIIQV